MLPRVKRNLALRLKTMNSGSEKYFEYCTTGNIHDNDLSQEFGAHSEIFTKNKLPGCCILKQLSEMSKEVSEAFGKRWEDWQTGKWGWLPGTTTKDGRSSKKGPAQPLPPWTWVNLKTSWPFQTQNERLRAQERGGSQWAEPALFNPGILMQQGPPCPN